jgi:prevent-host-death family protein
MLSLSKPLQVFQHLIFELDTKPYTHSMSIQATKGAEQARAELPSILDEAEAGKSTLITRRGKVVAAVIPIADLRVKPKISFTSLRGIAKGMWGEDSQKWLRELRDEWDD